MRWIVSKPPPHFGGSLRFIFSLLFFCSWTKKKVKKKDKGENNSQVPKILKYIIYAFVHI